MKISYLANNQHFGLFCEKVEVVKKETHESFVSLASLDKQIIKFKKNMDYFKLNLENLLDKYEKIAIYGAGTHGLGIASIFNLSSTNIKYFLDLNKLKSGKFSPKTHIPI